MNEEYALVSAANEVVKTVACDFARSVTSLNALAIVVILVSAAMLVYSLVTEMFGFSVVLPMIPLGPIVLALLWFYRFGELAESDKEYRAAKREVKRSLMLWTLILAAQLFCYFPVDLSALSRFRVK